MTIEYRLQKWTAEFEFSLLVKFQVMLNVFTDPSLLPEVHAILPFGTRLMEDHITNGTTCWVVIRAAKVLP